MKIKTAELIRAPLDFGVAKALSMDVEIIEYGGRPVLRFEHKLFHPSTEGDEVIDIMEREGIAAWLDFDGKTWRAADKRWTLADPDSEELARMSEPCSGPTLRIAVCRCFVASKLGDEVEVPDELVQGDLK